MRVVSIGEVLWDVFGEVEFLGGAPLNFSVNLHRLGNPVALLTAVGMDSRGTRALATIDELGLTAEFIQTVVGRPTGTAVVTIDETGSARYVIERPAAFDLVNANEALLKHLANFGPDWIYFGTLAQTEGQSEATLNQVIRRSPGAQLFYDMNLREGHWNLPLVERLSKLATVLKLNEDEAELLFNLAMGDRKFSLEDFCIYWSSTYGVKTICITLGANGCGVFRNGSLRTFPGCRVEVTDTVGAGDAFAAAFLHGLNCNWPIERIGQFANGLGALVASRAGATPAWTLDECLELSESALGSERS